MDPTYKTFCENLELCLSGHEDGMPADEDLLVRQRNQIRNLVRLETEFRDAVLASRWGEDVYRDFVTYILHTKRNILAARPFFRERHTVFTRFISKAFKEGNHKPLLRFRFNWSFIAWALNSRPWPKNSKVVKIANAVNKQRMDILEQNLPLAISQARIFWGKVPRSHLSYMDIVQIQAQGLLLAVDKFVPPNDARLSEKQSLARYRSFRAVAIGIMRRDRVNHYCLDSEVILTTCDGHQKKIKDFVPGDHVWGVDSNGRRIRTRVLRLHDQKIQNGYRVTFDDGYEVVCSRDHKFLTSVGMVPLKDIGTLGVLCDLQAQDVRLGSPLRSDFSNAKGGHPAREELSKMPGVVSSGSFGPVYSVSYPASGGMEVSVWRDICEQGFPGDSSQNLPQVYRTNKKQSLVTDRMGEVVGRESGIGSCFAEEKTRKVLGYVAAESRVAYADGRGSGIGDEAMARAKSRAIFGTPGQCPKQEKKFQNGAVASFVRDSDMERGADKMWGGEKTGRFYQSRRHLLGRNRRGVSLYQFGDPNFFQGLTRNHSAEGCDVESRGSEERGCYTGQDGFDVLLWSRETTEAAVAGVVTKDAPLASTGSLVLRRVVHICPVGKRRMYDLEVDHPKHNFLLPNGIVTSNSETLIHFYPKDKLKMYQANKILAKSVRQGLTESDFDALAKEVSTNLIDSGISTTGDELQSLLHAGSTVSADQTSDRHDDEDTLLDRYESALAGPEELYQKNQLLAQIKQHMSTLSVLEQKVLRLSGISIQPT